MPLPWPVTIGNAPNWTSAAVDVAFGAPEIKRAGVPDAVSENWPVPVAEVNFKLEIVELVKVELGVLNDCVEEDHVRFASPANTPPLLY